MKVKIKYFAAMREEAGLSEEVVDTVSRTVNELFDELNTKYGFKIEKGILKVAINEEYSNFSNEISELDTIVFIPPVAGG